MSHNNPGWPYDYEPTPAEWNEQFGSKQDWSPALDAVVNGVFQNIIFLTNVGGTANAVTATGGLTQYTKYQLISFTPIATNTGPMTLDSDGIGAIDILNAGSACVGGEAIKDVPMLLQGAGTAFNIVSQVPFSQPGSNAYPRSELVKSRELVSLADFKNVDGTQVSVANADNSTGIAAALAFAVGMMLFVPPAAGTYKYASAQTIDSVPSLTVKGGGVGDGSGYGSMLEYTGTGIAVTVSHSAYVNFEDLALKGNASAAGGFYYGGGAGVSSNCHNKNLSITGFSATNAYGTQLASIIRSQWDNCSTDNCYYGLWVNGSAADNCQFNTCQWILSGKWNIYGKAGYSHTFINCNSEQAQAEGVYISSGAAAPNNCYNWTFINLWTEANNAASGTAEIVVTADTSASADTHHIHFVELHGATNPGATYYLATYYCTACSVRYPYLEAGWTAVYFDPYSFQLASVSADKEGLNFTTAIGSYGLAQNSTTPSVPRALQYYYILNTAATVISNFVGGGPGWVIWVQIHDTLTSIPNGTNIQTIGGATISGMDAIACFVRGPFDSVWRQV